MQDQPLTLLCMPHLHWDHVWQRPQHLMSRFSAWCNVVVVDPPTVTASVDDLQVEEEQIQDNLVLIRPRFPAHCVSDEASYEQMWLRLLPQMLQRAGPSTILWASSPSAHYLVEAASSQVLFSIYDCMDDLASFRDGTEAMRWKEERLMRMCELVFTGGRSMYDARKHRHPAVFCFPSGVDVAHYQPVREPGFPEPAQVQHIPHPRLGYFGVLDERIDWSLIAEVARRRPSWHWVLVGPTAKIDAHEMAFAPNIQYVGKQDYHDLPAYLKSFDIATMPFALNEATRFISPTKTLEYLAGGKPVIATSIPDVVATYTGVVTIADGADAWIAAVEATLDGRAIDAGWHQRVLPLVEAGSWDGIASQMWNMIADTLRKSAGHGSVLAMPETALERSATPTRPTVMRRP